MIRYLTIGTFCVVGGTCSAASLDALDLTLTLDSTGFTDVAIYDDTDALVAEFDFLDATDDLWGITKPFDRFSVGQMVPLTATFDNTNGLLSDCLIGDFSCDGSRGIVDGDTFGFADGTGMTPWGDFFIDGGLNVTDQVSLVTFDGAPTFEFRAGDGYAVWDTYVQNFTVAENNLTPVPLPASLLLLAAGFSSLGLFRKLGHRRDTLV